MLTSQSFSLVSDLSLAASSLACVLPSLGVVSLADDDDPDVVATDSESIVSRSALADLCAEAAKLKTMGVMNQVCTLTDMIL